MKRLAHIAPTDEAHMEMAAFCWCNPVAVHAEEIGGFHEVDSYIIHSPDRKLDYRELIRKSFSTS
jgi:hypothetical protein